MPIHVEHRGPYRCPVCRLELDINGLSTAGTTRCSEFATSPCASATSLSPLNERGGWVYFETEFDTDFDAVGLYLRFAIEGRDAFNRRLVGEMWIDDVELGPVRADSHSAP